MKILTLVAMTLTLSLLSACGGSGDANIDNPAPTPDGVLLLGNDNENAINAIILLSPTPVDPSQIKNNRLLSTRLDAVINPAATVGDVNTALESVGAKINGMAANDPTVVLSIPEVTDRTAAQVIADTLQTNNAFFFVTVTFEAKPSAQNIGSTANAVLTTPMSFNALQAPIQPNDWYQAAHFPALSRADAVATAVNQPVTIIIPSTYAADTTTDSSNIPNQSFLDGILGDNTLVEYGDAETDPVLGSYGYSIASIIGINFNDGMSAYPKTSNNLLKIDSAPLSGLSYTAIVMAIANSIRDSITFETVDNKIILLTDFVYNDDDFSERSRVWRAIDGLNWRKIGGGFLHISAVGELGSSTGPASQAKYASPFAVSEAYLDFSLLLTEDPTLDFSSPAVDEFIELRFTLSNPPPIGNLLTVGSSRIDQFTRSDFSIPGADVRMIGENVEANCYTVSQNCVDNQWLMSDTGVAAAQIAALAAWMLNMDSTLNEVGVMTVIKHAYQNGQLVGIVDTYAALLSLDTSITEAAIRKSVLDVAGTSGTGVRDGIFDEGDIEFWFNTILPTFPDGIPFDLNGDGHIGGSDTVWFDLDINALPVYTTVMQTIGEEEVSFNEEAITDFDVLCYYAYSDLYTGDEEQRDALLLAGCTSGPADSKVEFIEFEYDRDVVAGCIMLDVDDGSINDLEEEITDVAAIPAALAAVNGLVSAAVSPDENSATSSLNLSSNIRLDPDGNILEISNVATMMAEVNMPQQPVGCFATAGFNFDYRFRVTQDTNFTLTGTLAGAPPGELPGGNISGTSAWVFLSGIPAYNFEGESNLSFSVSGVLTAGESSSFGVRCRARTPSLSTPAVVNSNMACNVTLTFE
ncbi:hypothetical protein MNBD_GAMMA05-750 [hydrothermal vent metagenome]|uniref:Uncharacterized protein n=1 Tax=hydrothermal vent metagenome TaxID=652676 RepID=A0A3B0WP40_9ZZZZ